MRFLKSNKDRLQLDKNKCFLKQVFTLIVVLLLYFVDIFIYEKLKHRKEKKNVISVVVWVSVISFLYGISLEILQHFVFKSRSADLWDMLANTSGVLAAAFLYKCTVNERSSVSEPAEK